MCSTIMDQRADMCGIAGFFGTRHIPDETVQSCLKLMGRRGPDASGVRRFTAPSGRQVLLLHTRLSIIDLDPRSNQPFNVGRRWMVLNGELYNYVELGKRLREDGAQFRTRSDTEVFLTAIDREGWDVLDRAEGMWALAVYDENDGSLTLSRDRFGEKPLYVVRAAEGLYFGSEPKVLFELMGRRLPVNREHLCRYLVNGYKSIYKTKAGFFQDLEEVQPASVLRMDAHGKEVEMRYWVPVCRPQDNMTYEEAVAGVRERLVQSLRLRLRSDVPLAFLMSGGVDSNALISLAKRVCHYDVHGFTIINEDERYDERDIVEQSARELGIRHTPVSITPDRFLDRLRDLVRYHDAPVFTITYYIQWLLMEQVRAHGYKISISGTGADELVTGYYDHHLMHLAEIKGTPQYHATLDAWRRHIQPIVRNPYLSNPDLFTENPEFRDHIFLNNEGFADYLTRPFQEPFTEERYATSLLRNRMLNEMFHEAVRVILHEDDLNAMYFSIENRSPFLDRDLFEFCYSIPTAHLIRDGFNKVVLRDAVRGLAPDCVVNERKKTGFNAPVLAFLDTADPAVRAGLLEDSPVFDLIRREKINDLLTKRDLPNSESKFLFYFVNTKVFLEEFAA
jgi:asparagine synthase (glutamine-hydrolysing)